MDHTDKQGQNRKQVKEEKKVLDGEWYVCLGGSMVGNTGMFSGESMQQDFTFTATEDWLDQRTISDSRTSKKENNRSLPEGQQSYMRGMLALDCPEGHKVPGKKCLYTVDLNFGTGYVFQTKQEKLFSGDRQPERFTLSLPLIFNRQVFLEDGSLDDTWSVEGSLNRDIKMEQADECEAILRRPHVNSCSYVEQENANWSLQRIRGPCDAYVSRFKGDVNINGKAVSGNVNLSKGDVIKTGHRSKVQVTVGRGEHYYIGSNTEFKMVDPCAEGFRPSDAKISNFRLWGGYLTAKIEDLLGLERDFEVATGTGGGGIRGEAPIPEVNILALLGNLLPQPKAVMAATLPEDFPTLGTRVADVVFSVETVPDEKVEVVVFKGSVLIKDNKSSRQLLLKEGQTVTSWEDGGPFEDVAITNAPD